MAVTAQAAQYAMSQVNPLQAYYAALLENPNVQRGLSVIRSAEGTARYNNPYSVAFGGSRISDLSWHPGTSRSFRETTGRRNSTTAAGAYQFLRGTWNGVAGKLGLTDFGPRSQDLAALALIDQRGGLNALAKGDWKTFADKVGREWASFPSSPYPQPTRSWGDIQNYWDMAGLEIRGAPVPQERPGGPQDMLREYTRAAEGMREAGILGLGNTGRSETFGAPVGPVERAPLGNTVVPPSIAPSGNTASPINAAPISPVQSGGPITDLTPSPPVDNQTLADAYRDMARGMDMMGVRGLDGRLGPQDPMEVGGKIEGDVNAPVEPVETAPRTEAPRTINERQVAAVSPVPTRSVQTTTISPVPESRGRLLGNLGEIAKGRGASIAGSVLGGAVAGPVGSIVGGLLGNAIRGNGSGQGLFSGGLLSGNDYATPTTGPRSTGPMAAFNPFNYRYTGHSNPLWNERRSQALSHWQTPSSNRSTNPGHLGTGLQAMAAVYSGTAPTGFTATSRSNPNVSAMSLHGMVAHTNTQHGWTAMVDPHTGVQMGTVYGKAAVYSPVDDTWSFQPMDEARMAAKRGLPTSLGPVGKQAKGLRSTDPNPAVTGKAQSKGPAAQMGLMSRGLMGPAQSIGPGKGSTGFGGLGTGGLLGMVAQALFGGPTSSPGLAGMAAGPSAGTGMGIGGGAGMGMGSFGGGFGFGGGIGDPSDSRSTNRA